MSFDPKAAGIVQVFDSLLATFDVGGSISHPYIAAALMLSSIYFVVLGAWNMAD